jgi:hypothetical protein
MVALLAIWLRLLSMLAKKNVCTTSYGSAPGNMVASINLASAKKNGCAISYGCATSYGSAPGNMVASVNLATAKKKWLHDLLWLRDLPWLR